MTAESVGETAIMARTLGRAAAVRVIVVKDRPAEGLPRGGGNNFIDKHVFAKLRKINVIPSALSTDEEFLRRVYLDTVGAAPTLDEARRFSTRKIRTSASKLIDQLLERPERADLWAMRFADMYPRGL